MKKVIKNLLFLTTIFSPLFTFAQATTITFSGTGTLTVNSWTSHSGITGQLTSLTSTSDVGNSLSYNGLPTSTNNRTSTIAGNSEDVNYVVSTINNVGSVYYSALIKLTNNIGQATNTTIGNYFMHLSDTNGATGVSTGFIGRLYVRSGSTANTFNLGVLNNLGGVPTSANIYGANPVDYPNNTTYLVVVKYTYSTNTASLWINPTISSTEPTALVSTNFGTGAAPLKSKSICIRQSGTLTAGTGNIEIDEIRVANNWVDVIGFLQNQITVTIPTANTAVTFTGNSASTIRRKPLGSNRSYERTAIKYTQAEVGSLGNISGLAFYCDTVLNPGRTPVKIYIKEVADTTFTASTVAAEEAGATLVFADTLNSTLFVKNTWVPITFSTPFLHATQSNIEIIIETNSGGTAGSDLTALSKGFRFSTKGVANSTQYWQSAANSSTLPTTNGTLTNFRPNIQLTITTAPACTTPPNAGSALSSAITACVGTNFTLSLSGSSTGLGLSYQWLSSTNNTSWDTIVGATLGSYQTNQVTAKYYACIIKCNGQKDTSTSVYVSMNPFYNCYCITNLGGGCTGNAIDSVSFTNTTLAKGSTGCATGSYTAYPASGNTTASLTQGETYTLSTKFTGSVKSSVWIDYNRNGIFENSEWQQLSLTSAIDSVINNNISIPANAQAGITGMRIRTRPSHLINDSTYACTYIGGNGETEDYLINIVPASAIISQYYYIPNFAPGGNPKGLNTDEENNNISGWTTISTISQTPIWSSIVTLPSNFNFLFNGTTISSYKVSTSGVLTFTTTASATPASTNTALSNSTIPNNSIMVWGLEASGANDVIKCKTFGNFPNRQHWIQFNSFSAPGSSGTNWSYWSIVLEESTNRIYIVDQRTYNTPLSLTLGIQINTSNFCQVTGAPNINSLVTNGGTITSPQDNIYYEFIPGIRPVKDIELQRIDMQNIGLIGSKDTLKYTVRNIGSDTIKSIILRYKLNNLIFTDTINNISISTNNVIQIKHKKIIVFPNIKTKYDLVAWVEYLGDNYHTNDSSFIKLNSLTFIPAKRILVESSRELWNQYSPRSEAKLSQLKINNNDKVSAVAIYENTYYYNNIFGAAAYPDGRIDRSQQRIDPSDFNSVFEIKKNSLVPFDISLSKTPNINIPSLSDIVVKVRMATDILGTYKLGLLFTEDSILTGPQSNFYTGGSNGIMGGFEALPNPVPLGSYEYNNYLKGILGTWNDGYWNLPKYLMADSLYQYTLSGFNYADYLISNPNRMHIIAYLKDSISGLVINCNELNFNKFINKIESQKNACNEKTITINGNKVLGTFLPSYKWKYSLIDSNSNFNNLPGNNNQVNYQLPDSLISKPNLWIRRFVYYGNQIDTSNTFLVLLNPKPTMKLYVDNYSQFLRRNVFHFKDSSYVQNGNISARYWDFGDGTSSTLKNPTKTYTNSGTYAVRLIVTTNNMCSDTINTIINVFGTNIITDNQTLCPGNTPSQINGNAITTISTPTYNWIQSTVSSSSTFSNAIGVNNLANFQPPPIFKNTWYKRIVFIGNYSDTSDAILIETFPKSKSKFSVIEANQCLINNQFVFIDSTTKVGTGIINYEWNFGDGTTSNLISPTKKYNVNGVYKVRLITYIEQSCQDTFLLNVIVYAKQNTIIKVSNLTQCLNENLFEFNDDSRVSTGTITSRTWDFGDGTISTSINPIKKYNSIGIYNVKLKTFTNNGCVDSTLKQVSVIKSPLAGSIAGVNTNVMPNTQYLYNINQQLNHTYEWQIENGAIISGQGTNAINIQWLNNGTGVLRCIITSTNNCTDTAKLQLNVGPTGINDIKNSNIKIYPTPTNNIINIEGLTKNENNTIQIFDVQGKLVITKTINEKGTIDLSELNKGVYVIKIGEVAQRIVKM